MVNWDGFRKVPVPPSLFGSINVYTARYEAKGVPTLCDMVRFHKPKG